jgi:hypothetical protein
MLKGRDRREIAAYGTGNGALPPERKTGVGCKEETLRVCKGLRLSELKK